MYINDIIEKTPVHLGEGKPFITQVRKLSNNYNELKSDKAILTIKDFDIHNTSKSYNHTISTTNY